MRPVLLALLALTLSAPAGATAQTTGPTGPANPLPPTATTEASAGVSQTAATVRARVNPNGGETRVQFQYGTTTSYGLTSATQTLPAGATAVDVQARLERLTPATAYHYRVVATNDAGVARGADRTFRTASPPRSPGVATDVAKDVTVDAATLQARVDPNRQAASYVFEYGTSTRYGAATAPAGAGAGDSGLRVAARVGGLRPDTTYHFRIRATNPSGSTAGSDRTFRTGKVPLGLSATASSSTVRYTRTLTLTGTVTGTDRRGVPITLERRSFPFDAGFHAFGSQLLTDSAGVVRFLVPPFTLTSQFRLVAPSRGGLTSNVATVRVRPLVKLRARRLRGGRVRLFGTVAPVSAAGRVSIQRRGANGRYAAVRRVRLRHSEGVGRFSAILRTRSQRTTYRAATRLTGGALIDGRSPIIRLRGGGQRSSTIRPFARREGAA